MNKFFIIGCPRSGTTMLQQALNRHSQIVIPPETKFFYYLYGQSRRRQLRHIERLRRDLEVDLPVPNHRIQTIVQAREYYDLVAETYCLRLERTPLWFGEKTPEHTSRIPLIRATFPNAKIVFIFRDGRDVALSLSKVPWLNCDINVGIWIWRRYHQMIQHAMQDRDLEFLCVRYEDIVSHPERELTSLLSFLDLPYEHAVANSCGNEEGIPKHELLWKARALEKIATTRKEVWKRELTSSQTCELESLAASSLTSAGYELMSIPSQTWNSSLYARLALGLARCAWTLPMPCMMNEVARCPQSLPAR